jgi:hypothetical protein
MCIHPQLKVLGHFVLPPSVCLSIPPHIACTGMFCLPSSSYSSQARSFFYFYRIIVHTTKVCILSELWFLHFFTKLWAVELEPNFFILLLMLTPLFNFILQDICTCAKCVHNTRICIFINFTKFSYSQTCFSDHLY